MATKLNIMTFIQQVHYLAEVNRRCPNPQPARRLVLPGASSAKAARRKSMIPITAQNLPDTEFLVAIIRVKDRALAPTLFAHDDRA
jgi:hypothetical protein